MSKYTPGPWEQGLLSKNHIWSASKDCVAVVGKDFYDDWLANARLIAAAPELAEALVEMLNQTERRVKRYSESDPDDLASVQAARAALKKAGVL